MFWRIFHAMAGVIVVIIAIMSLAGYIFKHENWYHWTTESPAMAVNTAIAFLLIGLAEIAETIYRYAEYKITKNKV